jgi:hypothetical protein
LTKHQQSWVEAATKYAKTLIITIRKKPAYIGGTVIEEKKEGYDPIRHSRSCANLMKNSPFIGYFCNFTE